MSENPAGGLDREAAAQAVQAFADSNLGPAEELVAAAEILVRAVTRFRKEAAAFRSRVGDDAAAAFARHELNDIICELQDIVGPATRSYNSLLRDTGGEDSGIPG